MGNHITRLVEQFIVALVTCSDVCANRIKSIGHFYLAQIGHDLVRCQMIKLPNIDRDVLINGCGRVKSTFRIGLGVLPALVSQYFFIDNV